ncbi:MAG: hypothetical protein ABJN26_21230 [Stappiaceae bacterium]
MKYAVKDRPTYLMLPCILVAFVLFFSVQAQAQSASVPIPQAKPTGIDVDLATEIEQQLESMLSEARDDTLPNSIVPYAPSNSDFQGNPEGIDEGALYLVARLKEDGANISNGMVWRVYDTEQNEEGRLDIVATSTGGDAEFRLKPGQYVVHAAYGFASALQQVAISKRVQTMTINLNAGGVKLDAVVDQTIPLPQDEVLFDVYRMDYDQRGERKVVAESVGKGEIVRLNADTYHVVSRYGDVNAVVRADIQIQPGKLVEAKIYHNAAEMTLKLVNEPGGEALAGTAWSILTPGGDVIVEGVGAFPSYVLAEGDYEVVAKYRGKNFVRNFTVEPGLDRDVEVLAIN